MKYLPLAAALALVLSACVEGTPARRPIPEPPDGTAEPSVQTSTAPIGTVAAMPRRWYLVPDGLDADDPVVVATFDRDPTPHRPRLRLRGDGRAVPMRPGAGSVWSAEIARGGLAPGEHVVELVVTLDGRDVVAAAIPFVLSAAEYVVWTVDFEGDAASDEQLAATAAVADRAKVPLTVMWNPRVWTTGAVPASRAGAMLEWTKDRGTKGDEIALHLHMWTDLVRSAGVSPRPEPSWAERGDGYDVPMYAYDEDETRRILDRSLALFADHGLPRPTSFRAASYMVRAHTLRAVAAAGFTADSSAAPAGSVGRLAYPWSLAPDAQPFRPSRDDHQRPGDLPLLEVPTNGGNTFEHSAASIQPVIRADLAMLAPPGTVATERRAVTFVSHPSTLTATERGAVEALVAAFEPLRYDRDSGPVRFVTLRELAQAYSR